MKKFTINCNFNGQMAPFDIYVGSPEPKHHPLHSQSAWLGQMRGGQIPGEVMEALSSLYNIAQKNNVSFEELCVYALGAAQQGVDAPTDDENAQEGAGNDKVARE